MLLRGKNVLAQLKSLAPPFDAETERELIATAFGDPDAKARAAATKLMLAHVTDAATLKATLGANFKRLHEGDACAKLWALDRPDRGLLATALVARGTQGRAVAFQENPDYARELLPAMLEQKDGGTLFLTEDKRGGRFSYIDLTTIPDVVFDEIPRLRKKLAFTHLMIWGAPMTDFPKRFVELAPFLTKLTLGFVDMTELPDEVCACTNLETIEIHGYKLAALNPSITKLKKLRKLRVTHSKVMTMLPPEICELAWLETLDLGFMKTKLPKEMGNMKSLKKLELQSSKISKLPAELAQTPLAHINIRWSRVRPEAVKAILPRVKIET
jgi:hypothetical protein